MLVWHAVWLRTSEPVPRLALWAEDSGRDPAPARRPGRPPRRRPHPFPATTGDLADALGPAADAAAPAEHPLWLPTARGAPVPSPELVREQPGPAGEVQVREWVVPALELPPEAALAAVDALVAGGAVLGASARHLAALAGFARDLVTRGRLLPTVEPAGPYPVWRPVLTGGDAAWAQSLALALPPAARCGDGDGGAAGAGRVTAAALDALVDAAARAALAAVRLADPDADPATDRVGGWLAGLTGPLRRIEPPAGLAAELAVWQRDATGGAVRACFRLQEPPPDGQEWTVQLALQAADEPSLVVSAADLWQDAGAVRSLTRRVDSPQETLLAELGRACRLYPGLEPALRTAQPQQLVLDTTGAHTFLTEGAPLLAGAGFGVLLPSWWTRPQARLGVRAAARSTAQPGQAGTARGLAQSDLVAFEWQLAIGDEALTESELADLTQLKAPLVRVRGQWVQVDPQRLAAGVRWLRDRASAGDDDTASVADLLRLAAGDADGPGGLPVTGVAADGWLADLLSGAAEQRLEPATEPDGFAVTLRPYQRRGLAWLRFLQRAGLGGVLADDMGLGKTAQTLALIAGDLEAGDQEASDRDAGPTLLVCPMSLVGNWQREAAKFAPELRVHVHHGAERARGADFADAVAAADLVITTYALASRDAVALREIAWRRVVVDEAQAIKNAATRQAAAVRALPARQRIALTGTPVENRLADLWSIMEFANPGLLGPAARFRQRYAEPVERHGDEQAAAALRRLTQPFILRRVKTDRSIISDLPEKLEMEVLCNLTSEQASLYQAVVEDMLAKVESSEGMERRGLVLATMTKLKQVCNHPAQLLRDGSRLPGRSGKLARLEEVLDEALAAGERALLFTQYAEFGAMLRAHLSARFGREVAWLHGGVPKAQRDDLVARFQSGRPDAPALFVLSLKAGGTGLNLTAANHVVHVDRWWNPAVEDQATDRAYRIGQHRAVQVRKLVCAGTVEEKVAAMIRDKRTLAERIVGTGEDWLTELSTAQLRELVALEPGAVVE